MTIEELGDNAPQWLREAKTKYADVTITASGYVIWHGGEWLGGWWHGGKWLDGEWLDGEWRGGEWRGGVWLGGTWHGPEDRLLYMAALSGIVFDAETGLASAYRTTRAGGVGRWDSTFIQPKGQFRDPTAKLAGSGTCVEGIHVTTAARAWTYFGVDPTCEFWRIYFKREDLLDCDGEKARIRGGFATRIPNPFMPVPRPESTQTEGDNAMAETRKYTT